MPIVTMCCWSRRIAGSSMSWPALIACAAFCSWSTVNEAMSCAADLQYRRFIRKALPSDDLRSCKISYNRYINVLCWANLHGSAETNKLQNLRIVRLPSTMVTQSPLSKSTQRHWNIALIQVASDSHWKQGRKSGSEIMRI